MTPNGGHANLTRTHPPEPNGRWSELPPPGWYPDPSDTSQQRLWSGVRWTGLRRQPSPEAVFDYEYFSDRRPSRSANGWGAAANGSAGTAADVVLPSRSDTTTAREDEPDGSRPVQTTATPDPPTTVSVSEPDLDSGGTPVRDLRPSQAPMAALRPTLGLVLARLKPYAPWAAAAAALVAVASLAAVFGTGSSPSPTAHRPLEHHSAPTVPTTAPTSSAPAQVAPPLAPPPVAPPTTAPTPLPPGLAAIPPGLVVPRSAPPAQAPAPPPPPTTTTPPRPTTTSPPTPSRTVLMPSNGSGIAQTASFNAPANWDVYWNYDCSSHGGPGNFDYSAYRSDGSSTDIYGPGQFGTGASGVQHYHEAGTFHLVINSDCAWDVQVVG